MDPVYKDQQLLKAAGITNPQDDKIHRLQKGSLDDLERYIEKNLARLSKLSSDYHDKNLKEMKDVYDNMFKAFQSFSKLASSAREWMSYGMTQDLDALESDLDTRIKAIGALITFEQDKLAREEIKRNQEVENRRIRNNEEFQKSNEKIIEAFKTSVRSTSGSISELIDDMHKTSDSFLDNYEKRSVDKEIIIFTKQKEQLDNYIAFMEDVFNESRESLEERDRELFKESLDQYKKQQDAFNTLMKTQMQGNLSLAGEMGIAVKDSLKEIKLGFTSFKDIFNTLNLHLITQALTNGAESSIDVMSQVARRRGMGYEDVKSEKSGFNPSDTYEGMLNASDIMKVYQMNNLSNEYLSDIASSVAMFEKETEISNESLNGMLLWAQNSGISRARTVQLLDFLQSMRDDGADVAGMAEYVSENAYILGEHAEEAVSIIQAFQEKGMNEVADTVAAIMAAGTSNVIKDQRKLLAYVGSNYNEIEQALQNDDYNKFGELISQNISSYADRASEGNKRAQYLYSEWAGFSSPQEIGDIKNTSTEDLMALVAQIESDTSTIESNAVTAGYMDGFQKNMNEASTTIVGDWLVSLEEKMKDHPILTALATESIGKIGANVAETFIKKGLTGISEFAGDVATDVATDQATTMLGSAIAGEGLGLGSVFEGMSGISGAVAAGVAGVIAAGMLAAAVAEGIREEKQDVEDAKDISAGMLLAKQMGDTTAEKTEMFKAEKELEENSGTWKQFWGEMSASIKELFSGEEVSTSRERNEETVRVGANDVYNNFSTVEDIIRAINEHGGGTEGIEFVSENIDKSEESVQKVSEAIRQLYAVQGQYADLIAATQVMQGVADTTVFDKYWEAVSAESTSDADVAAKRDRALALMQATDAAGMTGKENSLEWQRIRYSEDYGDIIDGSHANGLAYVPYDGYISELHRGERVLTDYESNLYTQMLNQLSVSNDDRPVDKSFVSSDSMSILSKLDNKEFQKIVKDGFEYIGRKLTEVVEASGRANTQVIATKSTLTSMYLKNQWGT